MRFFYSENQRTNFDIITMKNYLYLYVCIVCLHSYSKTVWTIKSFSRVTLSLHRWHSNSIRNENFIRFTRVQLSFKRVAVCACILPPTLLLLILLSLVPHYIHGVTVIWDRALILHCLNVRIPVLSAANAFMILFLTLWMLMMHLPLLLAL